MLCPNCKNTIDDDSRFCRFCGAEFVDDTANVIAEDDEVPEYATNEPTHYSPVVKNEPPQVSRIVTQQENTTQVKNKKNKATAIQLIVVLLVLVIVGGVLFFVGASTGKFGFGEAVTDAAGEQVRPGWGTTEITVEDVDGTSRVITTDRKLLTSEQILAEYTAVMNKLKADAPAFDYIRYQNLPSEKQNLGAVASFVLPIIEKYVTSKNAAQSTHISAGNANELPLKNSSAGCLVTDPSKVKNAYCEVLNDETYRLVLTFNDELNPTELSAGAVSTQGIINGVFEPYNAGEYITAISSLAMNNINFNYTNCTAEIVYNKNTQQAESVKMTMYIDITADTVFKQITAQIVDFTEYTIAY